MFRIFILLIVCCFCSCQATEKKVDVAFYHWQSEFELAPEKQQLLYQLSAKKIYLRFFDVDWDFNTSRTHPIGILNWKDSIPASFEMVPTIYITNRTFLQIPETEIPDLAKSILKKINALSANKIYQEIQLDCDWSEKTRSAYFDLLSALRSQLPTGIKISATIRLHQVKYWQRTGVPPVDNGVLMFYNMDDVGELETRNSIIDLAQAQKYLYNFDSYPMKLHLALPLFKWGVLFREDKMIKLINKLGEEELKDTTTFRKLEAEDFYQVEAPCYLKGHYLYEEDLIRLEAVSASELSKAAAMLKPHLTSDSLELIFFSLGADIIKNYTFEELETSCNNLR